MARLPATLPEIGDAVVALLAAHGPMTEEQLLDVLGATDLDLGSDPEEALLATLEEDDLAPMVLTLADDRLAHLPSLLAGRVFTHRLTAAEVSYGFLSVTPDLDAVSILVSDGAADCLADGTPLRQSYAGLDPDLEDRGVPVEDQPLVAWLLPPDRLAAAGRTAGDVVAVSLGEKGFELAHVADPGTAAAGVVAGTAALADELGLAGEPLETEHFLWTLCAADDAYFRSPTVPVGELLDRAGLELRQDFVARKGFDFEGWRVDARLKRLRRTHRLDEDQAIAVEVTAELFARIRDFHERAAAALAGIGNDDGPDALDALREQATTGIQPGAGESNFPVRDVLPMLADPDVAEAVLVECLGIGREAAPAFEVFAETLESNLPRHARVAGRWLRAKAYERLGRIDDAERALDAAYGLDPSWSPVLFDLARFASDRGDAERGITLLQRAGAVADDHLLTLLEQYRTPARALARNAPCWCGSGRKYKQCHLGRERLPLEERAGWLYAKAGHYLNDGPWRALVLTLADIRSEHDDRPEAYLRAVIDPLVGDAALFEGGAFEEFLAERGHLLPEDEQLLAQQWLLAERSVFELEAVRPGRGFTVRDVRTGERHEVREASASRQLSKGTLVCARIVPAGDTMQVFGGAEVVALRERDALVALLDSEPDAEQVVAFLSAKFAPPTVQNTEGEPMLLCEATLRTTDPAALAAALDEAYVRADEDAEAGERWHEFVVAHRMQRIRATLVLDGDLLTVETNSAERMDRVLARVLPIDAGITLVSDQRREVADLSEAMERAPGGAARSGSSVLDPTDPAVAEALAEVVARYEALWLDESIPALGGVTPREAAADPTRRPDLVRLLDSFPDHGEAGTMSPARLRAALRLDG